VILRAAALGFLVWLAATLAFRFLGQDFFYPTVSGHPFLLIGAAVACGFLAWGLIRLIGVVRGDEAEAAIALVFPGLLLDVFVTANFASVFPNLDPTLDGDFGALMLAGYGAMLFTGLLLTRLAPQDERL
jgi:hypothetical protein